MQILGVRIDAISRNEARFRLRNFLAGDGSHMVTTPNPEMLVLAEQDAAFRNTLNSGSLNVADGVGLLFAARMLGGSIPERITGVDLVTDLAEIAADKNIRMHFLGGNPDSAKKAAENLQKKYPLLTITTDHGAEIEYSRGLWSLDQSVLDHVIAAKPEILVVALGHGKQEIFIRDHLTKFSSVKIAVGVGGALEYYAGTVKRAPKFMRTIGLEWFWRLIQEPKRISRIFTAVVVFPFYIIRSKFRPVL